MTPEHLLSVPSVHPSCSGPVYVTPDTVHQRPFVSLYLAIGRGVVRGCPCLMDFQEIKDRRKDLALEGASSVSKYLERASEPNNELIQLPLRRPRRLSWIWVAHSTNLVN